MAEASYARACAGLRLCPRPEPKSVRGVKLRELAWLDPYAYEVLGVDAEAVESASRFLSSIRGGKCWFCGAPASMVVEVWDYRAKGGKGVAVLEAVRPACTRCAAVVEFRGSRRFLADRVARINGISLEAAEAVVDAVGRASSAMAGISEWEFHVDIAGVELAGKGLNQLFRILRESDARLRTGWLVKGYTGFTDCLPPSDPGVLIESLRAVGAEPAPAMYVQPLLPRGRMYVVWATSIPYIYAGKALKAILEFSPVNVEVAIPVSRGAGVEVSLEIRLPCYDNISYHEEAYRLFKSIVKAIGRSIRAVLVAREEGGSVYELAYATIV